MSGCKHKDDSRDAPQDRRPKPAKTYKEEQLKKALIPAIGALALIVGFMGIGTQTAKAEPSSVLLVNPAIVNSVTGGIFDLTLPDGSATGSLVGATTATVAATCTTDGVDPPPAPAVAGTCGVKEFDQLKGNGDGVLTAAEVTASGVDIDDNHVPSQAYVNLSAGYDVTEGIQFFGKIENLLDNDPPLTPSTAAIGNEQAISSGFDNIGRRYSIGVRLNF